MKLIKGTKAKIILSVITAVFGFLLICISGSSRNSNERQEPKIYDYASFLENRIEEIIVSATGTHEVDVLITLKEKESPVKTGKSSTVFSYIPDTQYDYGYSSEIAGVMIVCKGITTSEDFRTLKSAVATVLDISQSKIYIIGGE